MPYNLEWKRIDKSTDIFGQKEICGVGSLSTTLSDIMTMYLPMIGRNTVLSWYTGPDMNQSVFHADDSVSGRELLGSLCNLARQIDDRDNKVPYDQLIIRWCKENMYPYSIDFVYQELTEESFDITGYDAALLVYNGIFSINNFMKDLEKLYTTAFL